MENKLSQLSTKLKLKMSLAIFFTYYKIEYESVIKYDKWYASSDIIKCDFFPSPVKIAQTIVIN